MTSLILGFFTTILVLLASMEGDWGFYLQKHSIVLVIGGSFALLMFTTPNRIIWNLLSGIKDLFTEEHQLEKNKSELIELSRSKSSVKNSKNPLICYAIDLWESGVSEDLFVVLLSQKKDDLISEKSDAVHSLKNLSKYPPALGMIGTVMGMIALFSQLDSEAKNIGQNLALAMTATFFGLLLANGLFSPLADRLAINEVYHHRYFTNIYQILLLINADQPSALISEELKNRVS